ncbi:MAG: alanine--glyoxylate aminotransferase family protein [Caldilineae bacterium]|nr:MAG: alanine--glyoxylate aminotransferase family protein [Caldilineae bacterium]
MKLPAVSFRHQIRVHQIDTPPRILLGAGPSNPHPRVMEAMNAPLVGHLDPAFLQVMDEIQELLRYVWQTENEFTIAVSGTGTAAMQAAVANLVEPGDVVLVAVNGYFGERLFDMARRCGADVRRIDKPWGETFSLEELDAALRAHRPALLALVHAETSTGAEQRLDGVGELCRAYDALLLVDTVTSLGGLPLFLDEWGVDAAYSGSQKCLACPPGASPLTFNQRAMEKATHRKTPLPHWYFDVNLLKRYWGEERMYHHTAPINLYYGLREALRLVSEEGLLECWQRHRNNAELFWLGLADLGLACHVAYDSRLPSLTTVRVPEGVDAAGVVQHLRTHYNIEIAGGLGQLAGQVWRVGLMGFNSRAENVLLLLAALEEALGRAR